MAEITREQVEELRGLLDRLVARADGMSTSYHWSAVSTMREVERKFRPLLDLPALIARLREATEGSRELDHDIYRAMWSCPHATNNMLSQITPRYTTDLTAAVALCERVLPGWQGIIPIRKGGEVWIWPAQSASTGVRINADHSIPLALCLAILTAKEQADGR